MPTDRVTLNAQAITLPLTITQPGSYVLTSSFGGTAFQDGIIIDAGEVTLDLNGFMLGGVANSGTGIRINGAQENVVIRNGIIGGWDANGVDASSAVGCRLNDLVVFSVGGDGVRLGSNSLVADVHLRSAGGSALRVVGNDNRIDGCHMTACGFGMTVGGANNLIIRNSASNNVTDYAIGGGNAFGPIVVVAGAGDITAVPNADHPWANFALSCATSPDVCDGMDNDCNSGTPDGSGDPLNGASCDGGDTDLCVEGTYSCVAGSLVCSDATGNNIETCNGIDDDCDGPTDEGVSCGPNANCIGGSCACDVGFADCNAISADGCEVNTVGDPNNCGLCGFFCPSGICMNSVCKLQNGAACTLNSQCASNFCVDSVCCNTSCNLLCQACTAALKGSGANGTCGNIANGTDPQNECSMVPNLNCNGAGGCGP